MLNRELLVLVGQGDLKSIDSSLLKRCNRLAMTPIAMLEFEEADLPYKTLDDYYAYTEFRDDNNKLIKATEELFYSLDKKYGQFLNFPRAFSGNIYWFLGFLSSVYYISRVCERIQGIYSKVYVVSALGESQGLQTSVAFSLRGLIFEDIGKKLSNRVSMLKKMLNPEDIRIDAHNDKRSGFNIRKIIIKGRRILSKIETIGKASGTGDKKAIFIIQDDYEIGLLKKYLREFWQINPKRELLGNIEKDIEHKIKLEHLYEKEAKDFMCKWFPHFQDEVRDLFADYHDKILCRFPRFTKRLESAFRWYKPKALFYSIAAQNVYEDACAYFANTKKIPIFYFQHGGTAAFFQDPHQKFIEKNRNISKINILQSRIEKKMRDREDSEPKEALGSIKLFDLFNAYKKKNHKCPAKILYCPCPFNFISPRQLMVNIGDKELVQIHKDIINAVCKLKLSLDIKVHPSIERYNVLYFARLLRKYKAGNINILSGFPAEEILNNYGLLILEYVGQALFPVSIVLDTPVIAYLKDISSIRDETLADIKKRFYIARNREELEKHLESYRNSKLDSKFSLELVDRYAFPLERGNPRLAICDFIEKEISKR